MTRVGLIIISAILLCSTLAAQGLLNLPIDFVAQNQSLSQALVKLSNQTDIPISFSENFLPSDRRINLNLKQTPIRDILNRILKDTEVSFQIINETIVIVKKEAPLPRKFTISGYIEDAQNGERLIAATIYDQNSGKGTITNDYGFFSLILPEGPSRLTYSFLGYQIYEQNLKLEQDQNFTISLTPSLMLTEVVVTAKDTLALNLALSSESSELPLDLMKAFPKLGGEGDVLRFTHILPGVQTGADGVGGIHIRGGNADQNLILLDGVPVYNATHAVGVFSIFNSSAVRKVRLLKGGFPARYAGRLSSVLDVRTKEGNQKSVAAELQAGIIGGRLTVEGPLVKNKGAFFLAGRLAYLNFWLQPYVRRQKEQRNGQGNADYDFYDINAKLNYSLTKKDKIFLSLYKGGDDYFDESFTRDTFALKEVDVRYSDTLQQSLDWGNTIAALRWNRVWNNTLFSNFALTFSNYHFSSIDISNLNDFDLSSDLLLNRDITYQQFNSNIEDQAAKIDFEFSGWERHKLYFGTSLIRHEFQPGVLISNEIAQLSEIDNDTIFQNTSNLSYESGVYLEDDIQLNDRWNLNMGFHLAGLNVENTNYWSFQPRLSSTYQINASTNIWVSGGRMTQYLHLLTNSDFGLPTDLWVPSTAKVKPEEAWQANLGIEKKLSPTYEFNIDVYYKKLSQMLSFQTGSRLAFIDANNWEENVTVGEGRAYGVEWQLRKMKGKTKAWLNYTLSRSERQFDDINGGESYPFKYDRRHDLKFILSHRFNEKIEFTTNWVYGTGLAFTLATSTFEFTQGPDFISYNVYQVGKKNALRLPAYHRLDIGLNWYTQKDWGLMVLHLGVYNLYNRSNPLYYRLGRDPDNFLRRQFVQVRVLPIFPTISFTVSLD